MITVLLALAAGGCAAAVCSRPQPIVLQASGHFLVLGARWPRQAQFVQCGRYYLFPSATSQSRVVDLNEGFACGRGSDPELPPNPRQMMVSFGGRAVFAIWW